MVFGSPSVLYMFIVKAGNWLRKSPKSPQRCRIIADLPAAMVFGAEIVMQAERYYCIGDFENAEILANKAMYVSRSQEQNAIVMCALFLQVRLDILKGNLSSATAMLRQARKR